MARINPTQPNPVGAANDHDERFPLGLTAVIGLENGPRPSMIADRNF
jgi:hypothetical protein